MTIIFQQLQEQELKRNDATTCFRTEAGEVLPQFESAKTLINGSLIRIKLNDGSLITLDNYVRTKITWNNAINQETFSHAESKDVPLAFNATSSIVIADSTDGEIKFVIEENVKNSFKDIANPKETEKYDLMMFALLLKQVPNQPGVFEAKHHWQPWVIPQNEKLRISKTELSWKPEAIQEGRASEHNAPFAMVTGRYKHMSYAPRLISPTPPGGLTEDKIAASSQPKPTEGLNVVSPQNNGTEPFNYANKKAVLIENKEIILANGLRSQIKQNTKELTQCTTMMHATVCTPIAARRGQTATPKLTSPASLKLFDDPKTANVSATKRQALNLLQLLRFYCEEHVKAKIQDANTRWIKAYLNFLHQYHKIQQLPQKLREYLDLPMPATMKPHSDGNATPLATSIGATLNTTSAIGKVGEYQLFESGPSGLAMHFFIGMQLPKNCQDISAFKQKMQAELAIFHQQNIANGKFAASPEQEALAKKSIKKRQTDLFQKACALDYFNSKVWIAALTLLPQEDQNKFASNNRDEEQWKKLLRTINDNVAFEKLILMAAGATSIPAQTNPRLDIYNAHMVSLILAASTACSQLLKENLNVNEAARSFIQFLQREGSPESQCMGSADYLEALSKETEQFFKDIKTNNDGFTFQEHRKKQIREGRRNPAWKHHDIFRKVIEGFSRYNLLPVNDIAWKNINTGFLLKLDDVEISDKMVLARPIDEQQYTIYALELLDVVLLGKLLAAKIDKRLDRLKLKDAIHLTRADILALAATDEPAEEKQAIVIPPQQNAVPAVVAAPQQGAAPIAAAQQEENKPINPQLEQRSIILHCQLEHCILDYEYAVDDKAKSKLYDDAVTQLIGAPYQEIFLGNKQRFTEIILAALCNQNRTIPDDIDLGGQHEIYLIFRIRVLFQKLFEFNYLPESNGKPQKIVELKQEILHNLETLSLLQKVHATSAENGERDYPGLAEGIMQRLQTLSEGEEYTLATGWQEHAVTLNFVRIKDAIAIRIDNSVFIDHSIMEAWHGYEKGKNKDEILVHPAILGEIAQKDLAANKAYFIDLIRNMHRQANVDAISGIRHLYFNQHIKGLKKETSYGKNLTSFTAQADANCFYKCYEPGETYRSNRESALENMHYLKDAALAIQAANKPVVAAAARPVAGRRPR